MSKTLDQLISSAIAPLAMEYERSNSCNKEMLQHATNALASEYRQRVKEEIQAELTQAEIEQRIQEVDNAEAIHTAKKAFQEIRRFIIEGVLLACIIGLLVNQVTDLISYAKGTQNYVATLIIVAVLSILILLYLLLRMTDTIKTVLNIKGEKDARNP